MENKTVDFVHLHVHSYYSLLDGLSSPAKLCKTAKAHGMKALALTDHGVMCGAIDFYKSCLKEGIKPIIGCEVYVAPNGRLNKGSYDDKRSNHLVLLAKNLEGYKNLIKLTTLAQLEGFYYKPRIDHEILKEHSKGLIALSACFKGEIAESILNNDLDKSRKLITKYKSYFDEGDYYLEMQFQDEMKDQHNFVNSAIRELSKETNTPLVLTNDVHYAESKNREAHDILLCIQTGKTVLDTNRLSYSGVYSLLSEEEMREKFPNDDEAIMNTSRIADKCNLEIPLKNQLIPSFDTPEGYDTESYLIEQCNKGLMERYGSAKNFDEAQKRLEFELKIISKMGFSSYFLIVADFINYAREHDVLVGPGRGSAAGSIVAYCLKITDIDPLRYNLLFERFLNPERVSMPDIDIDFADDKREKILEYVIEKYGQDNVAQIITFGTMGAKAAIRDSGRALGLAYGFVDRIAKLIPTQVGITISDALEGEAELKSAYKEDAEVKKLVDMALQLEGVFRHASTHACAVVISEKPLTEYTPLMLGTKGDKSIVTQYSMKPIEEIGLLKMDFLGLKNLTILERTKKIILRTRDETINVDKISLEDKKTFSQLSKADTVGIFQLESGGMRRYLKNLKPSTFEDIIAMVSLYRPGSLDMKVDGGRTMVDIYIDRKHGKLKATYLDPCLEPILKPTYGVIIYQEQILQIAQDFAGYTLGEADLLRRAIGKKIKAEIQAQKVIFVERAIKNGKTKELALKLFSYIEPFARYGFNKSHAACYAMIAYETAFLKTHYPVEFLAACLSCDIGNNDRVKILIDDANKRNIKILPPSVNESLKNFTVTDDTKNIRFGLAAIKNIGDGPALAIIQARKVGGKFLSFEDFLLRLGSKFANKKVLESLAKSGALDCLIERNAVVCNIDQILSFVRALKSDVSEGQSDLFSSMDNSMMVHPKLNLNETENANNLEKLKWEKELIGMFVSEHPVEQFREHYTNKLTILSEASKARVNSKIKVGGIITSSKQIVTKKGDKMGFVTIEDFSGSIELIVFNGVYKKIQDLLVVDKLIMCEGKITKKGSFQGTEEAKIIADSVVELNEDNLKNDKANEDVAKQVEAIVDSEHDCDLELSNLHQNQRISQKEFYLKVETTNNIVNIFMPKTVQMNDLLEVKNILSSHKGDKITNLLIHDVKADNYSTVRVPFQVDFSESLHEKLDRVFL